ncbi:MAG: hypothetical protein M1814_006113 [Vezdaea aestivalis]|nr:MAG: hypothetical protein M1814_006113 [Vezdaea aestivalis]
MSHPGTPLATSNHVIPRGTVADRVALFTPKRNDQPSSPLSQRPYSRTPSRLSRLTAERDSFPNAGSRIALGKRREGSFGSPATRTSRYDDGIGDPFAAALRPDLMQKSRHGHVLRRTGHVGGQSSAPFEDALILDERDTLMTLEIIPDLDLSKPQVVDDNFLGFERHGERFEHDEQTSTKQETFDHYHTEGDRPQTPREHSDQKEAQLESYQSDWSDTSAALARSQEASKLSIRRSHSKLGEQSHERRVHAYGSKSSAESASKSYGKVDYHTQESRMSRRSLQDIRDDVQSVIDSSNSGRSVREQLERETQERFMIQKSNLTSPVRQTQKESSEVSSDDIHTLYCSDPSSSGDENSYDFDSSSDEDYIGGNSLRHDERTVELHGPKPIALHKKPKFLDDDKALDTEETEGF